MDSIKAVKILTLAIAAVVTSGCATSTFKATKESTEKAFDVAKEAFATTEVERKPIAIETNRFWVSKDAILVKEDNLPEIFNESMQLVFEPQTSLREATSFLSRTVGLRFSFASDVQKDSDKRILLTKFKQSTTLRNFLDQMAALSAPAMSWQFKENQVEFYRTKTKVFALNIPKTDNDFSADISTKTQSGGGGGSGGASGGSAGGTSSSTGHSVRLQSRLNFWDSVGQEITPMLTPSLGTLVVSKSTGNITVTDTPQALAAVAAYVEALNETALRRVFLDIQVITVQNNDSSNYGINWGMMYSALQSKYNVSVATPAIPSSISAAAGTISTVLKAGSGDFSGSSAIMAALSDQGKTAKVTAYPQWTMSGVPTHSAVNKSKAYVQSTTVTPAIVAGTSPSVSMVTSVSTVGVSLHSLPRVIDSNTIQLEESIEISSLDKLSPFGPAASQVQLPEESHMAFLPITTLKNGETLVLAGMDELDATISQTGVGGAENQLVVGATGTRTSASKRSTVIILITPHLY